MSVPAASNLSVIYPEKSVPQQQKRWNALLEQFKAEYGSFPDFVARSPGRVNLIGEHIDYSLYEVLPMAVEVDVLVAVKVQPSEQHPVIRISNVNRAKFESREFALSQNGEVDIDNSISEWTNYFKAGLKGATALLRKKRDGDFVAASMSIMVDGTVPSGGGLSSSAAFVCASALATLVGNGEADVDRKELVELAIVSERAVGVHSGGMDQSASVFPQQGKAVYVSFKPALSVKHIKIPETDPELTFVVAQSFVAADKHVTAPVCYNLRVAEVSLAAALLAKIFKLKQGLPHDESPLGISLRGFHDTYVEERSNIADNTKTSIEAFTDQLTSLVSMVEDYMIQEEGYSREDLSLLLGLPLEKLKQQFESKFEVRAERFMLRQRALHVFNEALRVLKFMSLLESPPSQEAGGDDALLRKLGDLMNQTQDSCRDMYQCSCAELDELCSIAREAGAYGSRLTGAGWGGCTVHLVPRHNVEKVKSAWIEKFYKKRYPDLPAEKLEEAIVVSRPGSGSCFLRVENGSLA